MGAGATRRLGVGRALVGGTWVPGDVTIDVSGRVQDVGRSPAGGGDRVAVPGFVDLQLNGAFGTDVVGADPDALEDLARRLGVHGVVAFAPTSYSAALDEHLAVLDSVRRVRERPEVGDRVLAVHLEGPFLASRWAGAHDPGHLRPPDPEVLRRLLDAGPVGMVTLAPELPGALELVAAAAARGVVVAVGHTDAVAAQVRAALDAGATFLTHAFNAHRRFGARDPGPVGVGLTDARCRVGLIADGHHLAPETLRLVLAAAGERTVVVSDAVAPAGLPDGAALLRGQAVTVAAGRVELPDGALAGSATLLDGALRHLLAIGVEPALAVGTLSTAPARLVGLGPHDLRPGSPARAVVLDDRWEVVS